MPSSTPKRSWFRRLGAALSQRVNRLDSKALALQIFLGAVVVVLSSTWYTTLTDYEAEYERVQAEIAQQKATEFELPPRTPSIVIAIGSIIADAGFLYSLLLRQSQSNRRRARIFQTALWIAAIGVLVAWLPTDFANSQAALFGKGFIGEHPSSLAYAGKLILIALLVISFPIASMIHFRSSLLDQYVIRNFLTPFSFCLIGFVAIWLIADLTDNAPDLVGSDAGTILKFYVIQLPFMILFVMPVTLLLSLLYSLSRMSKSNEIISMLGAGRSVMRVLRPLFVFGLYASLICLVFKYEWAPRSAGYKQGMLEQIDLERSDKKKSSKKKNLDNPWAKTGWMHINEVDGRTWFVQKVPFDMQRREMRGVAIRQHDEEGRPVVTFRATSAKWFFGPREWRLSNGKTFTYDEEGIPHVQAWDNLTIPNWRETPWKVLSSAQDPEYLGIPGLTTYLKSNPDYDERSLAPFRTNWWYCWAEPLSCLVMVLIAAPLGIVYSRRGVLGGVAASIIIFALMYFMSGSLVAAGQGGYLPPALAAWGTDLVFGLIGGILLWARATNRDLPTPKSFFSRRRARRAAAAAST
ncbi:MAG: LptF/LptG family permease [Verrucomicrobiae bacterium]|nr:LptF/LptG family permease [Verrucomicrobiae bacterium]